MNPEVLLSDNLKKQELAGNGTVGTSGMLMLQLAFWGFFFLSVCLFVHLVDGLVDNLTRQDSAFELRPQQAALSLRPLHEASVLLSAARQIGDDFVDRAVGDVLVDRETRLTCFQQSTNNRFNHLPQN